MKWSINRLRSVLFLATVALMLGTVLVSPGGTLARGGACTAVYVNGYDLSTGFIHIQGDGFAIDGKVEIYFYDDSVI